jgi:putative RNA 2'-phosphotransferase
MKNSRGVQISKFLSLVLRHQPEKIGMVLDEAGWVDVDVLLEAMARNGMALSAEELSVVVANSDKQRFRLSEDGKQIRANQGHSIPVELGYQPAVPPDVLYHGTPERFVASIRQQGLLKGQRHHVHLSADVASAEKVGERRGRPVVLAIDAAKMHREGSLFFVSDNGVWLTDHVPAMYLMFPE